MYFMVCYHPLQAYKLPGRAKLAFTQPSRGSLYFPQKVKCGQCIGCRLRNSVEWAIRMMHEASLHSSNCFITLTFSNENLPSNSSLDLKIFQDFYKRLKSYVRYHVSKSAAKAIRMFHCGEYGERTRRPHYHAVIFGYDFPDKVLWEHKNGNDLFRSKVLESLWPFGHSSIGGVSFSSAAYVARYVCKKLTGSLKSRYWVTDPDTGEILYSLKPEYATMSKKPGIGKGWIDKYLFDTYKDDIIKLRNGIEYQPPRFYDTQLEISSPEEYAVVKAERIRKAKLRPSVDLAVAEIVKKASIRKLVRTVDKER